MVFSAKELKYTNRWNNDGWMDEWEKGKEKYKATVNKKFIFLS